jgi:hypothetical protein
MQTSNEYPILFWCEGLIKVHMKVRVMEVFQNYFNSLTVESYMCIIITSLHTCLIVLKSYEGAWKLHWGKKIQIHDYWDEAWVISIISINYSGMCLDEADSQPSKTIFKQFWSILARHESTGVCSANHLLSLYCAANSSILNV